MHASMKRIQDGWEEITKDSTNDLISALALIPRIDSPGHKGSSGRIGIIGGSIDYHGAPSLAGLSALRCGSDMVEVFTVLDVATPLRALSPDLIVRPYLPARNSIATISSLYTAPAISTNIGLNIFSNDESNYKDLTESEKLDVELSYKLILTRLPALHALAIGPGMGIDPVTMAVVRKIIVYANMAGIPMVIDADGIRVLTNSDTSFINMLLLSRHTLAAMQSRYPDNSAYSKIGSAPIILTPNQREFSILTEFLEEHTEEVMIEGINNNPDIHNVAILCKGEEDVLWTREVEGKEWTSTKLTTAAYNCGRRCAGQGDLLAGLMACFLGWMNIAKVTTELTFIKGICKAGAIILRTSAIRVFYTSTSKENASISTAGSFLMTSYPRSRGLIASDILPELSSGILVLENMIRPLIWSSIQDSHQFKATNPGNEVTPCNHYMEPETTESQIRKAKKKNIYKGSGWFTDNWNVPKKGISDNATTASKSSDSQLYT